VRVWLLAIFLGVLPYQATGEDNMPLTIYEVKAKHAQRLLALPGVVSIGIGKDANGNSAIIVGLDKPRPTTESQIPDTLEDFTVVIKIAGTIRAQ
jgi:hypothetical protein